MNKLKVDITTLRATDGSRCPFLNTCQQLRVLIHCVSETTVKKAITTRSLGLNPSETSPRPVM